MSKGTSVNSDDERSATGELREKASDIKHDIQELGVAAKQMAQESLSQVRDAASDCMEQGRARAHDLSRSIENQIREQPLRSVLIAGGIGLLLGVLLIRR